MELHADRLPRSWGNRTAAFSHFFSEMEKQQYRVANQEVNFRKVDWYKQFKTVLPAKLPETLTLLQATTAAACFNTDIMCARLLSPIVD